MKVPAQPLRAARNKPLCGARFRAASAAVTNDFAAAMKNDTWRRLRTQGQMRVATLREHTDALDELEDLEAVGPEGPEADDPRDEDH